MLVLDAGIDDVKSAMAGDLVMLTPNGGWPACR